MCKQSGFHRARLTFGQTTGASPESEVKGVGIEVLAAAVVAYLLRKAARIGRRADQEVDRALDEGMDRLQQAVTARLGTDPALARLEDQAKAGEVTERTRRRAEDAIAEAAEEDQRFAGQIQALVEAIAQRETAIGAGSPEAVRNLISGGTQSGPVIMGRDFGRVTIHNPAPPTPRLIPPEEQARPVRGPYPAYNRFLSGLPLPNLRSAEWARPKVRLMGSTVYLPKESAYYRHDIDKMLEEIRGLISERDIAALGAYLMSRQPKVVESGNEPYHLYAAGPVDRYLDDLRRSVSAYLAEEDKS
ncbi:MAG TPA: hypothetical protein VMU95_24600 [Trebonia sp.]|nr:hypothetical protein [Trebonia sp.]